jgi:hypothetical protein
LVDHVTAQVIQGDAIHQRLAATDQTGILFYHYRSFVCISLEFIYLLASCFILTLLIPNEKFKKFAQ